MRIKSASLLLILLCPALAGAQVTEHWVARYHGPVAGSSDAARAIALDSNTGNIYVTGQSQGVGTGVDYATVAYDSSGNQLWEARYNGPGNGDDIANAIAVDSTSGNVYVTGQSQGVGTGVDYATVAYDSSGTQLWVARYNGPANGDDFAAAIALDSAGNVYVTGQSGEAFGTNSATVAYDSSGQELWVARYNALRTTSSALAIAVDSTSGTVYVTGDHINPPLVFFGTVAYDLTGTQVWVRDFNNAETAHARSIALGSTGNVYVTGWTLSFTGHAYKTVAYSRNGDQLWVAAYHPVVGRSDASAIAVDSNTEHVYVTGTAFLTDGLAYGTVAYDPSGTQVWVSTYDGAPPISLVNSIAVDSNTGNVYVTGPNQGVVGTDYATVAYDSAGNQLWVGRYHGPGNGDDIARAIAVDANTGIVYVTGQSQAVGAGSGYATIAYSQSCLGTAPAGR